MKYLTLAALTLIAAPAAAQDTSVEYCTVVSKIAEVAMKTRQTGATLHAVAGSLDAGLDGKELDVALAMIELAYAEPLYSTAEGKARATAEFSSNFFRACRNG